ncbi:MULTISPECIES: hypothetical protein [unclassified Brevundimonas]|uniref:hypothetical protein n=1 Tax=unclassified Brevundimonas TaxID=2622653 RepID=UPI0025C35C09|nr:MULTISPECIES: hypothetical protein [unclassified Brevundimonas]
MPVEQTPQEALALVLEGREQALGKMEYWPWWYDAGYAASCALLVAGQGFPTPISIVCVTVAITILVIIMRKWQAHTGVWVNGYSPKRARWAAIGLGVVLVGLMLLSIWAGRMQGLAWVPLLNGAVAACLGVIGMRVWMRLYRIDVRSMP